jgi:SAM-dependent methyltransferase
VQKGWCLICNGTTAVEFAVKLRDPVAGRLAKTEDAGVRFVICEKCGHVYQDPMLDAGDLARLYTDDYRPLYRTEQAEAGELERGRALCGDLAPLIESKIAAQNVLDIGCGSGSFLKAFQERGWSVYGIDPVPHWTDYVRRLVGGTDETIVTGTYGPSSFPGRTFSLILYSHTIEHIPDPVPMLRLMRSHLSGDGFLFVATPNLLDAPADNLFKGFLAGAHVRLFSPSALRTVLARAGFSVVTELFYDGSFGQGVLARPAAVVPQPVCDDARAIRAYFSALMRDNPANVFGRNLAALGQIQRSARRMLCRHSAPLAAMPDESDDGILRALPDPSAQLRQLPANASVVLLGLGTGELAGRLGEALGPRQHLFIWEADPAWAKILLSQADLSRLWRSGQATLLIGQKAMLGTDLLNRLRQPALVVTTGSVRTWKPATRQSIHRLIGLEPTPAIPACVT